METLFNIGNGGVLFGWAALVLLPFWRGSQVIAAVLIPARVVVGTAGLLATGYIAAEYMGVFDFYSFAGTMGPFAVMEHATNGKSVVMTCGELPEQIKSILESPMSAGTYFQDLSIQEAEKALGCAEI